MDVRTDEPEKQLEAYLITGNFLARTATYDKTSAHILAQLNNVVV
jgi:hypothetical protein